MNRFAKSLGSVILAGFVVSCSETSPKLVERPKVAPEKKVVTRTNPLGDKPKVDILFVIDDSASMDVHQATLATNIDLFLSSFVSGSTLDYHIGVTTTSVDESYWPRGFANGKLLGYPPIIDPQTPDLLLRLRNNLRVGIAGDGSEKMMEPMKLALTEPNLSGPNFGFYREDAYLAVIFITDAEDHTASMTPADGRDFLVNLKKGRPDAVSVYAVYIPTGAPATCVRDGDSSTVLKIESFLSLMHAQSFSLCDPAYGTKLTAIGQNLYAKLIKMLKLGRVPIVDTIRVSWGTQVIPQDLKRGWTYDAATVSIRFGDDLRLTPQPAGTEMKVDFTAVDFDTFQ